MKKIGAILVAVVMAFSLAACANEKETITAPLVGQADHATDLSDQSEPTVSDITTADVTTSSTLPVDLQQDGWQFGDEHAYYVIDGDVCRGTQTIDGVSYEFSQEGELQTGWVTVGSIRYHFADGVLSKGTQTIDGKTCLINDDGTMQVGWHTVDGQTKYYDYDTGAAYRGWRQIDGNTYYFDASGCLARSTTVDGVTIDENGVANAKEYDALKTTTTTTAAPTAPATTNPPIDNDALNQRLDGILSQYGSSPRNIYDYVHGHYTYKYAPEGSIEENALYMLDHGTGSCYNFASLTYLLFQRAGYDARYVTGLGWQNGHTYHCWVLANFDGGWYYVDSLYARSDKLTAADLKRIGYQWDQDAYPS